MLAIVGGVTALVAEAIIFVSYLLPYVTYDGSGGYAVFYGCVSAQDATTCNNFPLPWGIATAGGMIVVGLAVAILVIALKRRIAIALASGALVALGLQEFSDWVSFISSKDYSGAHLGAGVVVGVIGGLVLMAGGLTAAVSVVKHPAQVA